MIKSLRPLFLAGLLLPLALPVSAATINTSLTPNVEKALKASKLQPSALSLVMVPLDGPGTPTVFNAALNFRQFWDGRVETLEEQSNVVITSPHEMGSDWRTVIERIANAPDYRRDFAATYPDGVTRANVQQALASFERTLLTPNSRFDQYLLGNTDILTLEEKYGYQRFKEYGCIACHQGVNIGGNMFQKFGVMNDYFADRGNPTDADLGRFLITGDEQDRNVFKVPSLRNVAVTAPYFHDGSAKTLEQAVEVMFKYQLGRTPNPQDTRLIVKFLQTLTGQWQGKPL